MYELMLREDEPNDPAERCNSSRDESTGPDYATNFILIGHNEDVETDSDLIYESLMSKKGGPTQRTLTKVNNKVTQRTKLIHDLPQTRCILRCRVKSSCSEPDEMCVCSVLSTDFTF
jgi:hypothetical protein